MFFFQLAIIFLSKQMAFSQCYFHNIYKYANVNQSDFSNDIIWIEDGNFMTTGTTVVTSGNAAVFNVKVYQCGDTVWQKIYDYSPVGGEDGNKVLELDDSSLCIIGSHHDTTQGTGEGYVYFIDHNGNFLSSKIVNVGVNERLTDAVAYGNNIVIAGHYHYGPPNGGVFLAKTDNLGNVLWLFKGDSMKYYVYPTVNKTYDGGYFLSGRIEAANTNWFLTKIDSSGAFLWEKIYDKPLYQGFGYAITTRDSGYILVGNTELVSGNYSALMLKTDSNGDTLWTKEYGNPSNNHTFKMIQQLPDGSFIVAGGKREPDLVYYVWLLKLDEHGNVLWERQHTYYPPNFTYNSDNYVEGMTITPQGDIALTGYIIAGPGVPSHTTGNDMFILKVDSCGYLENNNINAQFTFTMDTLNKTIGFTNQSTEYCTALWYFGDSDSTYQKEPVHTYNDTGTYTITLIVRAGNSTDTILRQVVIAFDDTVGVGEVSSIKYQEAKLWVYPNPANEVLNFECQMQNIRIENVRIYDVRGSEKLNVKNGYKSIEINITELTTGLYFWVAQLSDGTIARGKFLKQ
ncbi:MAG: T9SS type A sorting domain-containing protein [Chitinophagales bacterium]|nr:T9SS type A sorting domain-containing protein [Chitinophagales bacterium]